MILTADEAAILTTARAKGRVHAAGNRARLVRGLKARRLLKGCGEAFRATDRGLELLAQYEGKSE